jgi:hypothetical protein
MMRFQVFMATSMKKAVLWDAATCSFRGVTASIIREIARLHGATSLKSDHQV